MRVPARDPCGRAPESGSGARTFGHSGRPTPGRWRRRCRHQFCNQSLRQVQDADAFAGKGARFEAVNAPSVGIGALDMRVALHVNVLRPRQRRPGFSAAQRLTATKAGCGSCGDGALSCDNLRVHTGPNIPAGGFCRSPGSLRRGYLGQYETASVHVTLARVLYSARSQRLFCMISAIISTARSTSVSSMNRGVKPQRMMSGARKSPITPRAIMACMIA